MNNRKRAIGRYKKRVFKRRLRASARRAMRNINIATDEVMRMGTITVGAGLALESFDAALSAIECEREEYIEFASPPFEGVIIDENDDCEIPDMRGKFPSGA